MFSFNFGPTENKESLSSDEEVEPALEVKVTRDGFKSDVTNYDDVKFGADIVIKTLTEESLLSSLKYDTDPSIEAAENSHSDLLPGIYEGGLKIWECTLFLGEYLVCNSISFKDKCVVDLGCGAGVLGILAKKLGAETVHFQDYNIGVLKHLTIPNVQINFSNISDARFWSGDWRGFKQHGFYDVILTSETIYNPKNYSKLHRLFKENLKADGVVYLAAKLYYFGVGGSLSEFCAFIEKKGIFTYNNLSTSKDGVKIAVIQIQFKN